MHLSVFLLAERQVGHPVCKKRAAAIQKALPNTTLDS